MGRLLNAFDRVAEFLACFLLVVLLADVTLGVITREFGEPLAWTDEIARFLMIWLAVFGWILATRHRTQVRIRFFQDLLPKAAWRGAEVLIQAAMIVFGLAIAWYGVVVTRRNLDLEATTIAISMAWMYVPMIPAGLITALQGLGELMEQTRRPRGLPPIGEGMIE